MSAVRTVILAAILALVAAACVDDEATGTTAAPTTTLVTTTTEVPITTLPTTTTTSTLPPTTATTTTTSLPPGAHPVFGTLWSDLLPDPAARARYRVDLAVTETPMQHNLGIAGDFEARMEYGVEWPRMEYAVEWGESVFDRLVIGLNATPTPGMAFYLDLDEPWVITFYGFEVWPVGDIGRGPEIVEQFLEPARFDLSGELGESAGVRGPVSVLGWGFEEFVADVTVTLLEADAGPLEVAAGTIEEAAVYEVVLSGPIVGGDAFHYPIQVTLSAGNPIVMVSLPGSSIELLEPWG